MDRHTPLSPTLSQETLPHRFDELIHFTTGIPTNAAAATHSQPASRYGTPAPDMHRSQSSQAYSEPRLQYHPVGGGGGSQLSYHQSMYSHDGSSYGVADVSQPYSTPATSPPTPSMEDLVRARRGRSRSRKPGAAPVNPLGPQSATARVKKASAGNKAKKPSGGGKKKSKGKEEVILPPLTKSLTELAKEYDEPVVDIEAYVNRTTEQRHHEVEFGKSKGKIKRPMNAFMLYRMAYQKVASKWSGHTNHQVISRVAGMSWIPHETQEFRDQFKAWSELEKDNHHVAFPDYKFKPAKPVKPPPQQQQQQQQHHHHQHHGYAESGYPDEESDLGSPSWDNDHPDAEYLPHPHHQQHHHALHHYGNMPLASPPAYSTVGSVHDQAGGRSAFQFSNPSSLAPPQYGQTGDYTTYTTRQATPQGIVEDILVLRNQSPGGGSVVSYPQYGGSQSGGGGGGGGMRMTYGLDRYDHHAHQQQQQQQQQQQHHHQGHHHHHQQQQSHSPGVDQQQQPQPPQQQRYDHHHIDPVLEASGYDPTGSFNPLMLDGTVVGAQSSWPSAGQLATGEGGDGHQHHQYSPSVGFLGLDSTLSIDQGVEHANLLRGSSNEWHREELPEGGEFDWTDGIGAQKAGG